MIGVYKITNPKSRIYIGQSVNLEKRQKDYNNLDNYQTQRKLFNSVLKYGWNNHKFEIVEECQLDVLNERERYWQDYYNCLKNGLNCRLTTTKDKSGQLSEETKTKISQSNLGKAMSEETKSKLRIVKKGINKGRKHTEEAKLKMSLAKTGKKLSKEHVESMRNTLKGKAAKNAKKVLDTETQIVYDNVEKAALSINLSYSKLYNMLSGRTINKTKMTFL